MKSAEQDGPEQSPTLAINSFNINDGLGKDHQIDEKGLQEAEPAIVANESSSARRRSPSPSVISTASSGSPLIRSDSSTSSDTLAGIVGTSRSRQHSSNQQQHQQVGPLKRPAPTSIAAAQLRQQQQGRAHPENHPNKSQKLQSGNKLAHMAKFPAKSQPHHDQPVDYRLKAIPIGDRSQAASQQREKPKKRPDDSEENSKSFGYNLGKALAYRANRFNEFWSINKMRYMNLACLLMTLVCLLTILLFSKTTMTTTSSQSASIETNGRQQQPNGGISLAERMKHRHRILEGAEQDRRDDYGEQETPVESIDSMDRQPFVRSPSQRHSAEHSDDEPANHEDSPTATRVTSSDGFNLFDERHEDSSGDSQSSSSKRSLDDLLQDARRQLRRQQENEQEMEESSSSNKSLQDSADTTTNSGNRQRPPGSIADPISQVLQDLDGFGLFKSIKTRLFDQLQHQNLTSKQPTIVRSKNGATIIMSFSSDPTSQNNSSLSQNETSAEAMPSFLRDLLPPIMSNSGASLFDRRPPSGFAAITINSEPVLSIRSGLPFGAATLDSSSSGGPFMMPSPFGFGLPPFMSASTPNQRSPLISSGGGFMSMLMRASNELANQMRHQSDAQANNQTAQTGVNDTTANANGGKQEPQASQQVKVIQLLGGGADTVSPDVAKNDSKPIVGNTTATANDEVETFGLGRLLTSPTTRQATFRMPLSPNFHSIYTTRRSAIPIGGSMMMIESSSGIPSSIISGESSSSSLAGGPLGPGALFLNEIGSSGGGVGGPSSLMPPFPIMPSVFLVGGQHQRAHGRFSEPVNPMLRSILSNVMSDLSQSVLDENNPRKAQTEDKPNSSATSRRDDNQDDNEWDELTGPQEAGGKSRSRSRSVDSSDLMGDSSDSPVSNQQSPMRFPAPLFEQMFDQLNNAGRARAFGTIKQTIRGPNGLMVERVIGLPTPSSASKAHEQHEVQAVPAGVRSQSLSRIDSAGPTSADNKGRHSSFARLFGGTDLSESDSASKPAVSSPMNFISQLLGQELASDRNDEVREMSPINSRGFRAAHISPLRPARRSIERSASFDMDSDDEQSFWPGLPRVRVASARIRLVSPRSDSGPMPLHFRLPAAGTDQQADESSETLPSLAQHQSRRLAASPFTSPSSPLFGFPIPKSVQAPLPTGQQVQEPNQSGDVEREQATEPPTNHRRQRSFVYHSNHEVAQNQARRMAPSSEERRGVPEIHLAESKSASPMAARPVQRQPLPPAASIVMGRRLDDFVEPQS